VEWVFWEDIGTESQPLEVLNSSGGNMPFLSVSNLINIAMDIQKIRCLRPGSFHLSEPSLKSKISTKVMLDVKRIISFNIKQLLYFFALKTQFRTAIFSKIKFQSSPNFYNYLILLYILMFFLGELIGELWGNLGELWGNFKSVCRKVPPRISI
jgi:hypothetical protein